MERGLFIAVGLNKRYSLEPPKCCFLKIPPMAIKKSERYFANMVALRGILSIGDQINKKIIVPLANANKLEKPDFNGVAPLGSGEQMVGCLTGRIRLI